MLTYYKYGTPQTLQPRLGLRPQVATVLPQIYVNARTHTS